MTSPFGGPASLTPPNRAVATLPLEVQRRHLAQLLGRLLARHWLHTRDRRESVSVASAVTPTSRPDPLPNDLSP
jgi:hypothetical protein